MKAPLSEALSLNGSETLCDFFLKIMLATATGNYKNRKDDANARKESQSM